MEMADICISLPDGLPPRQCREEVVLAHQLVIGTALWDANTIHHFDPIGSFSFMGAGKAVVSG
jgi:hypothetical protein